MIPSLCLGTAQFGLNYGISNKRGKIPEDEVIAILNKAHHFGIKHLDTAQGYGSAEIIIGKYQKEKNKKFSIINKLISHNKANYTEEDINLLEKKFEISCLRLSTSSIDYILLHNPLDIKKEGNNILKEWLLSLKQRSLVKGIGMSIYNSNELQEIDPRFLDIVELPISLYNQNNIIDGTVKSLKNNGSIIVARSIFLQGLLLTPASEFPNWVNKKIIEKHEKLSHFVNESKISLLDISLAYLKSLENIDTVILGISCLNDLDQIIKSWENNQNLIDTNWQEWSIKEKIFTDPRLWP